MIVEIRHSVDPSNRLFDIKLSFYNRNYSTVGLNPMQLNVPPLIIHATERPVNGDILMDQF